MEILLSSAYLPPIEYMRILASEEKVILEANENFIKQTWRNRCRIVTSNGSLDLSAPVLKSKGSKTPIQEVLFSDQESWSIKHWRAIESAYNASPYFLYYKDELENLICNPQQNLFSHNLSLIELLCDLIGITPKIILSESYIKTENCRYRDLRDVIHPKKDDLFNKESYVQVFAEKMSFVGKGISVLDLLFNLGPDTLDYLEKIDLQF
ncbi:MAG: WbqC family protein [Bacteroidales bacterium]